jgi:hypothetical protein
MLERLVLAKFLSPEKSRAERACLAEVAEW